MRKVRFLVIIMSVFLAVGGGILAYVGTNAKKPIPPSDEPRHPVTTEMIASAGKLDQKPAPFFKLPDTEGKQTVIGGAGPAPQFIYTVKKACPCSFDAEPLLQKLAKHWDYKVQFVAITDAIGVDAKHWKSDLSVPYPVVSNPKLEVMHAYDSPASVYCTLVNKEGIIVKRWAGYSKGYLKEMNEEMAKLLGEPVKPFDSQYAPDQKSSGCTYEGYVEKTGL